MAGGGLKFLDSLSGVLSGLGRIFSPRALINVTIKTQAEIEIAYRMSWLARKIHDIPPYDMTRAWRLWQAQKDQITAIEAEERRLGLRHKVRRALTLARLHGGGALFLGLPGNPDEAVEPDAIGKGKLAYVHVLSRYQVQVTELETDALSPFYGQPKFYNLSSSGRGATPIHPSRVVAFVGQPLPEGMIGMTPDHFWGDPLMISLAEALDQSEETQRSIADLLREAKIDVIKIPDLMELVGNPEYEKKLMKRLALAQGFKSTANALLISGSSGENSPGEDWETRQLNLSGLPDLAKVMLQVAAGAADIPATRLLSQSPMGMNATGDSDLRNYYDMLSGRQTGDLQPSLDPLDEMLIRSALGARPPEISYNWEKLWQLTPTESAVIAFQKSQAVQIYTQGGLVPTRALEEGVQNMLVEDGLLPGLEAALLAMPEDERFPSLAPEPAPDPTAGVGPRDPATGLPASQPTARPGAAPAAPRRAAANDERFTDASPRTLYVSRAVLNAAAIIAHFKGQGFDALQPAAAMHVTIAFSRTPIDWMAVASTWSTKPNGELQVPAGGPRIVERLGDKGAIVLEFSSTELQWRHQDILESGASWDFASYVPHITLTYAALDGVDLEAVEPWRGQIDLGPEIFEEVIDDWETGVVEE